MLSSLTNLLVKILLVDDCLKHKGLKSPALFSPIKNNKNGQSPGGKMKNKWKKMVNIPNVVIVLLAVAATVIISINFGKVKISRSIVDSLKVTVDNLKTGNENLRNDLSSVENQSNHWEKITRYLRISEKFVEAGFRMIPNKLIEKEIQKLSFRKDWQLANFYPLGGRTTPQVIYDGMTPNGAPWYEGQIQTFLKKLFLTPKNVGLFWKSKKNVIINSLKKKEDADRFLEAFKWALRPSKEITELYHGKSQNHGFTTYKEENKTYRYGWDNLYDLKNVGDIGLTTTWIRHQARMEEKEKGSSVKMKKELTKIFKEIENELN